MQNNNGVSKNGIRGYIILGVIFAVFCVIAFAPPFAKTGTFWIAYLFALIAIGYQIYVFKISFTRGADTKSKFYGFPIARVGVIYLIIQLLISLIQLILSSIIPAWVAIIINVLPLAYAIIGCIAADAMRDEIERQDSQLKADVSNMRALQSFSASLIGLCNDDATKETIQNLADEFKYSDPVSSEKTKDLEYELEQQLKDVQKTLLDGDVSAIELQCTKIMASLSERNRICALNK